MCACSGPAAAVHPPLNSPEGACNAAASRRDPQSWTQGPASVVGGVGGGAVHELVELVGLEHCWANVLRIHKALQEGQQREQLAVLLVVVPALYGNAIWQLVPESLCAHTTPQYFSLHPHASAPNS